MRAFLAVIASAVVLAGCAAETAKKFYVRTDGGSVDLAREQATLAQCKGEAATSVPPPNSGAGYLDQARNKENTLIVACMARNGYIIQTQ